MRKQEFEQLLNIKRILNISTEQTQSTDCKTLKQFVKQKEGVGSNPLINIIGVDKNFIKKNNKELFYSQVTDKNINTKTIKKVKKFIFSALNDSDLSLNNIQFFLKLLMKYNKYFDEAYHNSILELVDRTYEYIYREQDINNTLPNLNLLLALDIELAYLYKKSVSSTTLNNHLSIFKKLHEKKYQQSDYTLGLYYQTCLMGLLTIHHFISDSSSDFLSKGIDTDTLSLGYMIFQDAEAHYLKKEVSSFSTLYNYCASKIMDILIPSVGKTNFDFNSHENHLILNLYEKCKDYRYSITIDDIVYFLKQFSKKSIAISVLNILNSEMIFLRLNQLSELISSVLRDRDIKEYNFSIFGEHDGSSSIINYLVGHSKLGVDESYFSNIPNALEQGKTICFVDDCLLSGTQAIEILEKYSKDYNFKNIAIIFTFAVAMDEGIKKLKSYLENNNYTNFEILYGTTLVESNKILESSQNYLYNNHEQQVSLKEELKKIGFEILETRASEKGWTQSKREENSLGYGNKQKILIFEYGVPKSTLTFLWEKGKYNKKDWIPLFQHYNH